ncbi:MAG: NAD(P)-dependent oxidoreductase [Candidatus Aminicenantes bacterium]|jgi:nucleoside-diphosphate-sugar epimerase
MARKALVTGGTGFIGSHLVQTLVSQNWDVTCLVRPTSRTGFLKKFSVNFVIHETDDQGSLESAVKGQDYIFHLAGRIRPTSRANYDKANHQLTRNLVEACLSQNPGISRFVYVSSIAAAGPSFSGQYSVESQPPSPASEYGRTKLKGEMAVQDAWDTLPATIIRPPNVYGPRQQETELLIKLISKRIVPILKERGETTSLIYIRDLVEGILQAALSPKTQKQIYYLTDGKGYSWRELILTIKKHVLGNSLFFPLHEEAILFAALMTDVVMATGLVKVFFGRKVWEAMVQTPWLFSTSKAEKEFGFHTRYTLEEGIKETVNYYGVAS